MGTTTAGLVAASRKEVTTTYVQTIFIIWYQWTFFPVSSKVFILSFIFMLSCIETTRKIVRQIDRIIVLTLFFKASAGQKVAHPRFTFIV